MGRKRTAEVGVGLLLLLAACGDDGGGSGAGTALPTTTANAGDDPTTSTAADESTTSTTATTTFAQADDPPTLVNTGEDFDAIVRSFVAYSSWVTAHPDPTLVSTIVRPDSPAFGEMEPYVAQIASSGYRTDGLNPSSVRETRVLERPGAALAIVYVVTDNPAYTLIDESGEVVQEIAEDLGVAAAWELRRGGDGRWLIENRTVLGHV
jgi:hypothetical protein